MGMMGVSDLKAGRSIPSQADLGRFTSRDPIGFKGGLNLFNGAGTNPVTMVDPDGLDTVITYTRGKPKRYSDGQFAEAITALMEAQPGDIDTIDFYGHGNPEVCIAGKALFMGSEGYGTGGIKLSRNGGVHFWADLTKDTQGTPGGVPALIYRASIQKVLGGKKVKRIRFHSCHAAGGDPNPTEENLARYVSLNLKGIAVEGSYGYYQFQKQGQVERLGSPVYEEVLTYVNGVKQGPPVIYRNGILSHD